MPDRTNLIDAFLAATDWATASKRPLAGDASLRKYMRIGDNSTGTPAILMDADPALGNDIAPFVRITRYLRSVGLSAPSIYAQDDAHGLLLIEDLGDDLFARVVAATPDAEMPLYTAATDVLLHLHKHPAPALDLYDNRLMTDMAALSYRWYLRGAEGRADETRLDTFNSAIFSLLETEVARPSILIQRDYHAENLLWLPQREGVQSVGLLDYQDALLGHPAYDLVSLLKDARRDVSAPVEAAMLDRYITISRVDATGFRRAFHVLGLQRNLRILGVFARLSLHFGKPSYVDLIPRVWRYIERDLETDVCAPLADQILADLPRPTPQVLERLKEQCGTIPTL